MLKGYNVKSSQMGTYFGKMSDKNKKKLSTNDQKWLCHRLFKQALTLLLSAIALGLSTGCEECEDWKENMPRPLPQTETTENSFTLELSTSDDTGFDSSDGYTNLTSGDRVAIFTLKNTNAFQIGDVISIYRNDDTEDLLTYTTIGDEWYQLRAEGAKSFNIHIPGFEFKEGTFTLRAIHKNAREDVISPQIVITHDTTAPIINIVNPNTAPASSKVISATDNDAEETVWTYKQIRSTTICSELIFPISSSLYTEGAQLIFSNAGDNDTKICFSVTDLAGNVAYAESTIITGIE